MSSQFAPIPWVPGIDPCPECLQGKCGNCDGTTWDIVADEPAPCPCAKRGHEARRDALISEEAEIARRMREFFGPDDPDYVIIPCACTGAPPGVETRMCSCALNVEAARRAGKMPEVTS